MTEMQATGAAVPGSKLSRVAALAYGLAAYLVFFVTFLYAVGFIADLVVPKTIDSGPDAPFGEALVVNLLLMSLFAGL